MHKHIRWLHEQLPEWVKRGAISPAQADAIRGFYPGPKATLPWSMLIFSGFGAVLIGLGFILVLAYNWHAIPKFGKLGLLFVSLVAAHAGGVTLLRAPDWRRQLGEALGVLGTMLFGAGIWLVAQVYHIDEHYPNGFLFWGLGALAMAWALPSVAQGVLAGAALTIWGGTERFGFGTAVHWAPLLLAAGVGALAWRERSRLLLAVVLSGFYYLILTNSACGRGDLAFPVAMNVSVLLLALSGFARRSERFPQSTGTLQFFGWVGFLLVVYLQSFHGVADEAMLWHKPLDPDEPWLPLALYGWLPFALALAAWTRLALGVRNRGFETASVLKEEWLVPLTAVLNQMLAVGIPLVGERMVDGRMAAAGIFNLVFLAVASMWMARGCREGELKPVVLGSLALVALTFARYFDLFENLVLRGMVFLIVGGVLFAEGFFYRRARQRTQAERSQS